MKRFLFMLRIVGCVLCGAGCVFFFLPVFRRGFALGAGFGMFICLLGLGLLLFFGKLSKMGGWKQAVVRLVTAFYCMGLAWAVYLSILMLSVQANTPPENTNVIVLGAQVYGEERMGISLTGRVNAAYDYLSKNPDTLCIVTGGQGGDEPCPEAVTEKNVLTKMGIEEDRIFLEDQSHNTRENLVFAKEIAEEQGMGTKVAVVTQGFHMYRAVQLAKAAGFEPYSLVAETDPLLFPEYYGRELLSLTKWWIERLVIE